MTGMIQLWTSMDQFEPMILVQLMLMHLMYPILGLSVQKSRVPASQTVSQYKKNPGDYGCVV